MDKFITLFLVIGFGLGATYKFSLFSPEIKVSLLDFGVLISTLLCLTRNPRILLHNKLFRPIMLFGAVSLFSLLLSFSRYGPISLLVGLSYILRWLLYSLFAVSLSQFIKPSSASQLFVKLGLLTVLIGLAQYLLIPDIRPLEAFDWDPHYFRVVAQFLDPGFTGLILVFTLIKITLTPLATKYHFLAWSSTYLAMALTYSRASYLAFLVAMAVIAVKLKGAKFFLKMLVLLTITIIVLPRPGGEGVRLERTNSLLARVYNWRNSLTVWKDHPVLGTGFNLYRYVQRDYGFLNENWRENHAGAGADSSLFFVLATTGILGASAYVWYLISLSRLKFMPFFLLPLLAHSFFLNSLFYPPVLLLLGLITAGSLPSTPVGSDSKPGQSPR